MDQLELDLRARVLAFPIARNARQVKAIADRLDVLQGEDAAAYWREVVTTTRAELVALGLGREEIDRQVIDLFDAVQEALTYMVIATTENGF